jgi:acetate kinase
MVKRASGDQAAKALRLGQQAPVAKTDKPSPAGDAGPPAPVPSHDADGFSQVSEPAELPGVDADAPRGPSSILAVRAPPKKPGAQRMAMVLNCGSSSIKFQIAREGGKASITGKLERVGEAESKLTLIAGGNKHEIERPIDNHQEGLALIVDALTDDEIGGMDLADISSVGHRVVHGGPEFTEPVRITDAVEASITEYAKLAPLHNPPALNGIAAVRELFGDKMPQVAVFDTAFHTSMAAEASSYALPKEWRDEGVRRYGFHGISVENATKRAAKLLGRPASETNLIVCHLGNGASITAVEGGRSKDTSMGMTPLAGVMMGTRPGDVDVGVVFHMAKQGMSLEQIESDLNKRSGLLGLSDGLSNDVRELLAAEEGGDEHAALALEKYTEDIVEQIGAFTAKLKGDVHGIVFTGGVGENSGVIRGRIMSHFKAFGYDLDPKKNDGRVGDEANLSRGDGPQVLVVRANEEGAIAEEAFRLTKTSRPKSGQKKAKS